MTDDELERRKEETWGMDEVRDGSLAQEDTEASSHGEDSSDTTDTEDIAKAETATEADTVSDRAVNESEGIGSDTADTAQPENLADVSDTADTTDPKVTTGESAPQNSSDTSDRDASSVSKEPVKGDTVRQMALDAEAKGLAVRDLRNVNVYLYEDIHREMVSIFKALDAEYYQTHGEDLSKNKDFFNAIFRAGLNSPRLREELKLEEE